MIGDGVRVRTREEPLVRVRGEALCFTGACALALATIGSFFNRYAIDDSFIGYANAQNLAAGHGFAFDPGDRLLTTSAPLVVPLYAFLAAFAHADIVLLGQIASALAILALTFGTYAFVRRSCGDAGAFCAVAVLLGSPTLVLLWSHESLLWAAFAIWALVALDRERDAVAGLLLGAALLTRPETMLTVIVFAGWIVVRRGAPATVPFLAAALLPFAGWLVYAWLTFGTLVSQSALAKHAQVLYEGYPYLLGLLVSPAHTYAIFIGRIGELTFALVPAALLFVARAGGWSRSYWWFVAWVAATTVAYAATGLHFFAWYGLQVPVLVAFAAAIPWAVARPRNGAAMMRLARGASIALVALHLAVFGRMAFAPESRYNVDDDFVMPRLGDNGYERLGRWFAEHAGPNDSIAYPEVGQLRYYSQRRIVSTDGLATPGVAQHLLAHNGMWVYERYRPTIVVDEPIAWISTLDVREEDWFARAYRPAERLVFADPDPARRDPARDTFVIDRLVDAAAIPPPAEIDTRAASTMRVVPTSDGLRATFTSAAAGISRIEMRVATAHCRTGRLQIASAGVTIGRTFVTTPALAIERLTLDASALPAVAGTYVVTLSGCSANALAAPRYRPGAFGFFAPLALATAPRAQAIVAFARTVTTSSLR